MTAMTSPTMIFPCPQGFQAVLFVPMPAAVPARPQPSSSSQEERESLVSKHLQKQFRKTRLCNQYLQGRCRRGAECNFAHSEQELSAAPDLSKTKLCFNFFRGQCFKESCAFAHSYEELRATSGFLKTELCHGWAQGRCRFGASCRFAHGASQLRGAAAPVTAELAEPQQMNPPSRTCDEASSQVLSRSGTSHALWSDMADSDGEFDEASTFIPKDLESDGRSTRSGCDSMTSDASDVISVISDATVEQHQRTTLRVAGLSTALSRTKFVELLWNEDLCEFDFVYLPSDFKRPGCCFGYGFVNFSSSEAAAKAQARLQGRFDITWAHDQGREAYVERFRNSPVMHPKVGDEMKPALYQAGRRMKFPPPTKRIAAPRMKKL